MHFKKQLFYSCVNYTAFSGKIKKLVGNGPLLSTFSKINISYDTFKDSTKFTIEPRNFIGKRIGT